MREKTSKIFTGIHLDYGVNDGHVTNKLFGDKKKEDIFVADLENKVLEKLKDKWIFKKINIEDSSIEVNDSFFDSISCIHVIEHLKNPDLMIREFSRLLKQKGKLYIEAPNTRSILTPSLRLGMTWNFFDDPTHVRPYSKGALCSLLKSNGFKIIRSGIYRKWIYALALPIAPILSIALREWRPLHYALIHAIGWSSFVYCEKETENEKFQ